jgi:hypothetical protein
MEYLTSAPYPNDITMQIETTTLLSRREAAAVSKLCTKSVDRAMYAGELRYIKLGGRVFTTAEYINEWYKTFTCMGRIAAPAVQPQSN